MKRFRWIFALAAVVLVVAISFVIMRNNRRSAVEKYKAELRANGEKLSFAELGFPRTPENPESLQRLTNALNRISSNGFVNAGGILAMTIDYVAPGKASVSWRKDTLATISSQPTNSTNWEKLQAQCDSASNELAKVRSALEHPFKCCDYDPEKSFFNPSYQYVAMRDAAQWIYTDGLCAMHGKHHHLAAENIHALVQLTEFNKEDPMLRPQMMRITIAGLGMSLMWEALQSPDWIEEELAFFQKDWERVEIFQAAQTGFLGGRALMEMGFSMIHSNGFRDTLRHMIPSNSGSQTWESIKDIPASSIWRLSAEKNELFAFKQYQGALECVRNLDHLPWPEIHAKEVELQIEGGKTFDGGKIGFGLKHYQYAMSVLIIPNTAGYSQLIERHETFRRLTITAIALKRFQLRHGHFPTALNELVPEFISAVPVDPMNIQPLHYKLNTNGTFVLYSVGEDGKDDGGDPTPTNSKSPPDLWNARDAVWPVAEESSNIQAPSTRE